MSRINAGIDPKNLVDAHLLAEHREITRICGLFTLSKINPARLADIPKKFTLGAGHVRFFLDKGAFTGMRYLQLYEECKRRGFNVVNCITSWDTYNTNRQYTKNWQPTEQDNNLIKERIKERLAGMNNLKYYGKPITLQQAIELLNK